MKKTDVYSILERYSNWSARVYFILHHRFTSSTWTSLEAVNQRLHHISLLERENDTVSDRQETGFDSGVISELFREVNTELCVFITLGLQNCSV